MKFKFQTPDRPLSKAELKKKQEVIQNARKVQKYKRLQRKLNKAGETPDLKTTEDVHSDKQTETNDYEKKNGGIKSSNKRKRVNQWERLKKENEANRLKQEEERQAKEAEREEKTRRRKEAEKKRKEIKVKLKKVTKSGQPVMKHRMEALLDKIQKKFL